ncbi:hypothetical protein ATN37_09060 [Rhodococcus sp. MH15]|nr:hypothetical protein [Rhodococcus sp. MH15]
MRGHGRKVEVYSYMQNFSPDEFDVNNPDDVKRVNDLGRMLAEDMHSADYLVVTHVDSKAAISTTTSTSATTTISPGSRCNGTPHGRKASTRPTTP